MNTLNCISYNINGLNHPIERKKILNQLKKCKCSIAFLQETHLNVNEHKKLRRDWVGQVYSASCESTKKRGVAILCHKSLGLIPEKVTEDKNGRYIIVVGSVGGTKITLLNLYAPNEDDAGFFKEISALLAANAEGFIITGGDFNCVMNQKMDKHPPEQ